MPPRLPETGSVLDIRYGGDPALDALLLHFTTENNIEYFTNPMENASPEQVRFIVALDDDSFYAPCSDWMFWQLLKGERSRDLLVEYLRQWKTVIHLARSRCSDVNIRRRIIALCRYKFRTALASCIYIPSRLQKRMLTIFMAQSGQDDPSRQRRLDRNKAAAEVLAGRGMRAIMEACPSESLACRGLTDMRFELDFVEVKRLLCLATVSIGRIMDGEEGKQLARADAECRAMDQEFEPLRPILATGRRNILLLPERSGGLLFDIRLARALISQGHRVVLALKEGFYFEAPTYWDVEHDPVLAESLAGARFLSEVRLSKNELLRAMASNPFLVISDGTRERFNPYRLSVTFARAWKECDLVLAKGEEHYRRLLMTSHRFTRDVFCWFRDDQGHLHIHFKEGAEWVRKFGESAIRAKAEEIILGMRRARAMGNKVMFYSGIIGSIPGQTDQAITIMNTFVEHLRRRLDAVYIINPAEHFEEGMDADDLMYMWEMVQRSGFIDLWRFQTHQDIEKSFELREKKVPPVWAGKDATYSTGCTKEMQIALDVLKKTPEMQIIGPNAERFFRRREYGVGKYCDVAIDECHL